MNFDSRDEKLSMYLHTPWPIVDSHLSSPRILHAENSITLNWLDLTENIQEKFFSSTSYLLLLSPSQYSDQGINQKKFEICYQLLGKPHPPPFTPFFPPYFIFTLSFYLHSFLIPGTNSYPSFPSFFSTILLYHRFVPFYSLSPNAPLCPLVICTILSPNPYPEP